jgi:hypothetical protein
MKYHAHKCRRISALSLNREQPIISFHLPVPPRAARRRRLCRSVHCCIILQHDAVATLSITHTASGRWELHAPQNAVPAQLPPQQADLLAQALHCRQEGAAAQQRQP